MKQLTLDDNIEHSSSLARTPRVHFNLSTTAHSRNNMVTQPPLITSKDTIPQSTNDSSLYQGKTISKTPKYTSIKLFNNNNTHLTEHFNNEFFNENGKVNHFKGHGTSLLKAYQDKGNTTQRSKFMKSKTMLHSIHYDDNNNNNNKHKRTHNTLHTLEYDTLPIMLLPKKPCIPDTKGLLTKREELLLKNIDKHLLPDKDQTLHLKQELIDHCAIRNKQPCNIQGCLHSLSKVIDFKQRSRRKSFSLQPHYLTNNNNTATISATTIDNTIEENVDSNMNHKTLLTFNDDTDGLFKRFRKTKTLAFTSLKSRDALLKRNFDWLDESYKMYKECAKKGTKKANKIAGTIMDIIGEYEEPNEDQNGFSVNNLNRVIILKQIQKGHFDEGAFDSVSTRRGTKKTREKTIAALSKLGPPNFLKNNFKASTIIKFKQNTGIFMGSKEKEKI